jgi:Transposase DDE domain group 1
MHLLPIRCSSSISLVISSAARCVPATSTAPTAGTTCSTRSWPAIGTRYRASTSAPTQPLPCQGYLEEKRIAYAIRLPANRVLQERIGHLLKRPVGRPPNRVRRSHASFHYQAGSWTKPRRVIAKVEWYPGELVPRVGFIVTNVSRPAERVVAFYNQRGTAEQWIKEGKGAIRWTRLSCRSFAADAVRLQLHALAYNLGNFLRTLAMPEPIKDWSLTSLKEKLIKIGAKVVTQGPYVAFQMAEVAVSRTLFAELLGLIAELRPPPDPKPA